jgi:hypothetical protein
MIKRLKTSTGVVAGLCALALGGSAIASAANTTPKPAAPAAETTTGPDIGSVQSGNQTAPDPAATTKSSTGAGPSTPENASENTSENTSENASENAVETSGESPANNDGPGGYADQAGNANADTQQQGQN